MDQFGNTLCAKALIAGIACLLWSWPQTCACPSLYGHCALIKRISDSIASATVESFDCASKNCGKLYSDVAIEREPFSLVSSICITTILYPFGCLAVMVQVSLIPL